MVYTWYILQFFKPRNKCRKYIIHFRKVFRSRPLTPFDLRPTFCAKWKTLKMYIILEDSSFRPCFREVRVAMILNLFWVVFHGILLQMPSNLYKSLISNAIILSQKIEFLALRAFRFRRSWRCIIVISFISIIFVVVK